MTPACLLLGLAPEAVPGNKKHTLLKYIPALSGVTLNVAVPTTGALPVFSAL